MTPEARVIRSCRNGNKTCPSRGYRCAQARWPCAPRSGSSYRQISALGMSGDRRQVLSAWRPWTPTLSGHDRPRSLCGRTKSVALARRRWPSRAGQSGRRPYNRPASQPAYWSLIIRAGRPHEHATILARRCAGDALGATKVNGKRTGNPHQLRHGPVADGA
jgi:hypothetical protein